MAFNLLRRRPRVGQSDAEAVLKAASRSLAMIEFALDGTILSANDNFLQTLGYSLDEIVGRHHRIFVDPQEAVSDAYLQFWERLRAGEFQAAEFLRITKDGRDVWIQAQYNPILDASGKVVRIVKFAADITAQKRASSDAAGQLAAIGRAQAVIEFALDGTVLTANQNFLDSLGYTLEEIRGKHHRIFVDPAYAQSAEYAAFWKKLSAGEYNAAEHRRVGKGGRTVWIQASYNPIFDPRGKPYKVVKYATDITARKMAVETIGAALGELAAGDLTAQIHTPLPGELDDVRKAFNFSLDRFSEVIGKLRGSSASIRSATREILDGANDLSDRTTKQAAAIEETSAAMEQLATTVNENARRANEANGMTRTVSNTAEEAGEVMRRSNEAMQRISASSAKIANIIRLIDDIAFQTNLLALNASVEAARAGEAGKGFAVVAIEVRRLAQSAAQASSEIKGLIELSAGEVGDGTKLVAEATDKLSSMLVGVRDSAALVDAIAKATLSQSSAISQMNSAVQEMDKVTQSNAALVEQINASIAQAEDEAMQMDSAVEVFTVDHPAATSAPAAGVQRASTSPARTAAKPKLRPSAHPVAAVRRGEPKARAAAKTYLSQGGAALKDDWSEF